MNKNNQNLTKRFATRAGILALSASLMLAGCATPQSQRAADTFGRGVVNLVLSPIMIVSGLAQGLAFLPYTIGTGLDELNKGLARADAVSLEDSYQAVHGVSIADPRVDRRSGQVAGRQAGYGAGFGEHRPQAMMDATLAFRRLLTSQGMPAAKAEQYALVGNYRHVRIGGQILLAVVHRPAGMAPIRVRSKDTGIVTTLRPQHRSWLTAYERDVTGVRIDEVIDWTSIEYSSLKQDKVVAMLMVLAAESIKSGKRSPDYWSAERHWMDGDTRAAIVASRNKVRHIVTG